MELQEELIAMKLEKKEGEEEITALKYELASITKNFEEIQQNSKTENKEKDALEKVKFYVMTNKSICIVSIKITCKSFDVTQLFSFEV